MIYFLSYQTFIKNLLNNFLHPITNKKFNKISIKESFLNNFGDGFSLQIHQLKQFLVFLFQLFKSLLTQSFHKLRV